MSEEQKERYYQATQWQLMWWKFRKHLLARVALVVLAILYFLAVFSEFVAPYNATMRLEEFEDSPPSPIHFFADGKLVGPYVYKMTSDIDPNTFRMTYTEDRSERFPIRFFAKGEPYKMWGFIHGDIHLFTTDGAPVMLFGADRLARDLFSRTVYGARISLSIGLMGVFLSLILGIILGGISGYVGGMVDVIIQRIIEFLRSLPAIPLWLTLGAALPPSWPPLRIYFGITIILSLIGWTGLARVRQAARAAGGGFCDVNGSWVPTDASWPCTCSHRSPAT